MTVQSTDDKKMLEGFLLKALCFFGGTKRILYMCNQNRIFAYNARSEELFDKPYYRNSWNKRCLVICTGFFELFILWDQEIPIFFNMEGDRTASWLLPDLTKPDLTDLMKPYGHDEKLSAYRVLDGVTNSRLNTNVPQVIEPFRENPSLF